MNWIGLPFILGKGRSRSRRKSRNRAKHRFVPIHPVLAAWLAPYEGATGRVTPYSLWRIMRKVRKRAGLETWDEDIIRYSFSSYRLVITKAASALALEMGNSESVIHGHYRRPVTEKVAQEFFSLFPTTDITQNA